MNKKQFIGEIIHRERKKVYDKKSQYFKQFYYKLEANNNYEELKIFAYKNQVNSKVWITIESKDCLAKKYRFTVQRSKWGWILLDWEEIKALSNT